MAQPTISRIRDCIRSASYVLSAHAEQGVEDDGLTINDVKNVLLTGRLVERQRDGRTREYKYVVQGSALDGCDVEVVVKFGFGTGRLYIITVYLD